jgi:hypothetical protein
MTTWYKPWKTRGRRGNARRSARKLSCRVPLRAEALEDCLLPSPTPTMLVDINLALMPASTARQ